MAKFPAVILLLFSFLHAGAQDSVWSLASSIQYAREHNIDINQSAFNERLAALQFQQSRLSQLPNASVSGNYGYSFGRSIDPTTNQFVDAGYSFSGLNGNADVLLFGWFQKRNTIEQNKLLYQAAGADLDQLKDDVSLNVATGFLRILLAQEQINVAQNQLQLSSQQKAQTQAFVDAGTKPELDLEQMIAQVAADSTAYITAVGDYTSSILDMKALLNLDMKSNYNVDMPRVEDLDFSGVLTTNAEEIYQIARQHFGTPKSSRLKAEAAEKSLKAAKGALYPQLSIGAQLGTNYASSLKEVTDFKVMGAERTGNFVDVNGTPYDVYQPTFDYTQHTIPFFKQLNNNFRQTVAVSINVPLLNGWVARTAVKQAAIDVESKKLAILQSERKLQQDVYKAYNDAKIAVQKYYSAHHAATASQKAYEYAQKRYELGLVNSVELLTTQNTAFKSRTDEASAKYDMIFKLKVIDYYLGKELKL